ncbi:hypothetical protein EJ04DRAFT_511221 [Polyplosphaeria fusca]|uniref:Uncharacterized protein n=1 Tax=Polyplosphaeria fusca TaxID=682080 RepID=A0A9P4QZ31_9PLEO|nr:hypothetical protein EJ04DRAFT_511221 [Polyplosphaeria fusca]
MSPAGAALPPSSSLPPIRALITASEEQITAALQNLQKIYCPLRLPVAIHAPSHRADKTAHLAPPTPVDSGYVSRDEASVSLDLEEALLDLRTDPFERETTIRWLTALIGRADTLAFSSEDSRDSALDDAAFILSSFSDSADEEEPEHLTRDFLFACPLASENVQVQLNDAPLSGTDHTDVGLQSWGASIILSEMLCSDPKRFSLTALAQDSTIIELGAGTGLVALTLGKLVPSINHGTSPRIMATDYHPTVLTNLRTNIATNFPHPTPRLAVEALQLDWASPPDAQKVELLIAADVVYDRTHAILLRDCAARMLAPCGTFWLMVTVREVGKFEGIAATVEAAFIEDDVSKSQDGRKLEIVEKTEIAKRKGTGRGDEKGYALYKIGWA